MGFITGNSSGCFSLAGGLREQPAVAIFGMCLLQIRQKHIFALPPRKIWPPIHPSTNTFAKPLNQLKSKKIQKNRVCFPSCSSWQLMNLLDNMYMRRPSRRTSHLGRGPLLLPTITRTVPPCPNPKLLWGNRQRPTGLDPATVMTSTASAKRCCGRALPLSCQPKKIVMTPTFAQINPWSRGDRENTLAPVSQWWWVRFWKWKSKTSERHGPKPQGWITPTTSPRTHRRLESDLWSLSLSSFGTTGKGEQLFWGQKSRIIQQLSCCVQREDFF